jgi:hypothetical protein
VNRREVRELEDGALASRRPARGLTAFAEKRVPRFEER